MGDFFAAFIGLALAGFALGGLAVLIVEFVKAIYG